VVGGGENVGVPGPGGDKKSGKGGLHAKIIFHCRAMGRLTVKEIGPGQNWTAKLRGGISVASYRKTSQILGKTSIGESVGAPVADEKGRQCRKKGGGNIKKESLGRSGGWALRMGGAGSYGA